MADKGKIKMSSLSTFIIISILMLTCPIFLIILFCLFFSLSSSFPKFFKTIRTFVLDH